MTPSVFWSRITAIPDARDDRTLLNMLSESERPVTPITLSRTPSNALLEMTTFWPAGREP